MTTLEPAVLVVGSLHHDIMIQADHLPRRDETAVGSHWYPKFGGKGGNQAVAAARTGALTRMLGAVGDDDFGRFLLAGLDRAGVERRSVAVLSNLGSGMSVAIVDSTGDYAATIVSGANFAIDAGALRDDELWHGVGVLVLQNEVPEAINLAAALQAHGRDVTVVLNAAPTRKLSSQLSSLIDVLIVNSVEAEMMGTPPVNDLESAGLAAEVLARRFVDVVVTAGAAGLAVAGRSGSLSIPARKVIAVSSHGAGDCFVGTLAAALAQKAKLADACAAASAAAADLVAGKHLG